MITVIGLTQFAFLALAVATLKILVHSSSSTAGPVQTLDRLSLWFFSIPVIWTGCATLSAQFSGAPQTVTYVIGIGLAVVSFLLLAAVVLYVPSFF
jgi:hypothetical protein